MVSPLFEAISEHDYEKARQLINKGVNIHDKEDFFEERLTPLELLDKLNTFSPHNTPVITAQQEKRKPEYEAFRGFLQEKLLDTILNVLAKAYAQAFIAYPKYLSSARDDNRDAIMRYPAYLSSVLNDHRNTINLLIERRPTLCNLKGCNILHFIASSDNFELIASIKKKVSSAIFETLINQQTIVSGFTPLMLAINQGNFSMAEALINRNALVDVVDSQGNTALQILEKYEEKISFYDENISDSIFIVRECLKEGKTRMKREDSVRESTIPSTSHSSFSTVQKSLENSVSVLPESSDSRLSEYTQSREATCHRSVASQQGSILARINAGGSSGLRGKTLAAQKKELKEYQFENPLRSLRK